MTIENAIRLMAGSLATLGVALGAPASPLFVSSWFLWAPAFVGLMLAQRAVTGFCPAALVFKALGLKEGGAACAVPGRKAA